MTPRRWGGGPGVSAILLRQTFGLQAAAILLGLSLLPLAVVPLELQKRIIDEAIPAADLGALYWLGGLYLAAAMLRAGVKFAVLSLRRWIAEVVARVLRIALVDAQRRRSRAEARRRLGATTSVMAAEVDPIGGFAAQALNTPLLQGGARSSPSAASCSRPSRRWPRWGWWRSQPRW